MNSGLDHVEGWTPSWATHPGEHLAEQIEARGWSQADLARLAGLTPKLVPVTTETAIKLERALGMKAEIWVGLQSNWDLFQARARLAKQAAVETPSDG